MANRPQGNPLPVDENVQVPAAVRRAAEAANKHYEAPPKDQPAPVTPPGNEPPPAAIEPQPPAATPPAAAPAPQPEDWEAKFKSENGRVRAQAAQISNLQQTVTGLETIIDEMRQQLTARPAPVAPAAPASSITDKEREDFGEEMLGVVGRVARDVVTPEVAQLRETVAQLTARLDGTEGHLKKNAREQMYADLQSAIPNWKEINFSDEFKAWLALPDPYTGAIRMKLLTQAHEQNKTPQVLAFFKGFLDQEAALDPQPGTQLAPAQPQQPKPSLEDFAAPGRARTPAGGPPSPVEKPTITTAQIDAFYAMVRRGEYNGREEEKDRLEKMIFDAQRDGRVRRV